MERIEQAVVLAAGEGQRLRPFTALKPKVMIRIANKPILQYVVEALEQNGIHDLVVVVGYRKEQVQDFLGSGENFGVNVSYIVQAQQLGTGHALRQSQGMVGEEFLVVSGDNIVEASTIADLVTSKPNTILVKKQEAVSKYGVVVVKDGTVQELIEKPEEAPSHLVNTGTYIFSRKIFDFLEEEIDLTSAIQRMVAQEYKIAAYETSGTWLDVVYFWDMLKLNDVALRRISPGIGGTIERGVTIKGLVFIGKDSVIRANSYIIGPATIGENCDIGPNVCIFPATSIGNNVAIAPFTEIGNSIIGDNVTLGSSSSIVDSIIDRGCVVKGHFIARSGQTDIKMENGYHQVQMGAMLGEYCTIEDNVIVYPGITIGNRSRIKAMRVLERSIPDESLVV